MYQPDQGIGMQQLLQDKEESYNLGPAGVDTDQQAGN